MDADGLARFLAGSPDRRRLLARLRTSPDTPSDVADALDSSHRSVQRNLAELVDRGLAEKRHGVYALTTVGELVAERHAAYLDTLDTLCEYEQFFGHLPDAEHTPDPDLLCDADGAVATATYPQAAVDYYLDVLDSRSSSRIRMLSPVLSRQFHRVHADHVLRGVDTDLVLAAETVETARSLNPVEFAFVLRVDGFRLYRYPNDVALGLTLGDDWAVVNAYDDDGQLRACVSGDDPEFVAWAETLYDRYRSPSTRVEPSSDLPFGRGG
ncbi:Predicted transcriptional regulator, contains HTH domain [Halogranum amylolyticum]|uniref:Predicted transcriptional regulator, contains HTH domain n=1 Tax=Halogranum amylolyticum TaxID=660520 RepID=A0A1H8QKI0_9EURY|nr:helix-turn-helix domain-containing protein [Halogranum amylolyticum]SEO54414.1 Predicted transcriptional regulator, contains HTH domain [Halogranum amylolyticum]